MIITLCGEVKNESWVGKLNFDEESVSYIFELNHGEGWVVGFKNGISFFVSSGSVEDCTQNAKIINNWKATNDWGQS